MVNELPRHYATTQLKIWGVSIISKDWSSKASIAISILLFFKSADFEFKQMKSLGYAGPQA